MKYKYLLVFLTIFLISCTSKVENSVSDGIYKTYRNPDGVIGVVKDPLPADYSFFFEGKTEFPRFDSNSGQMWQVDVRSADLSGFDLSDRYADIVGACFDSKTIWPEKLPVNFDPDAVMEQGKDPGLGVRRLHEQGVTGKGIALAIIDQGLLTTHIEYKDRLRFYEEIHYVQETSMHGAAVASIAVGKTAGVAPEADLYYIAETPGTYTSSGFDYDLSYVASSIDRIIEINKLLPKDSKIRAISISLGLDVYAKNVELVQESIKRAAAENIFVISVDSAGLGISRVYNSDPNEYKNMRPGLFWGAEFRRNPESNYYKTDVFYPMDYRCTASPTGESDYVFYTGGGMSWAVPYMAGLYILCCQVDPEITPARFQQLALETAETVEFDEGGKKYQLPHVINPVSLIAKLKSKT